MNIFAISLRTVQQFPASVLLFAAANAGIALAVVGLNMILGFPAGEGVVLSNLQKTYLFGIDIFVAAGVAAAQCLAFAGLGKAIDRPVWRIGGPGEALKRFFSLWFGMNLIVVAMERVQLAAYDIWGEEGPGMFLYGLIFLGHVVMVPFGAAVMFHGKLVWAELNDALQPVFRFGAQVGVLALATFAVLAPLAYIENTSVQTPWLQPCLVAIYAMWECVVFTGVWLLCITHRESPPEDDDFDF